MDIFNCLKEECIQVGTEAKNKEEVLRDIAKLAKKSELLSNVSEDELFEALAEREKIGSTGFENGIAIPHCRLNIDKFVVGLLLLPDGIDFEAYDNNSSNFLFFIIAPDSDRDQHIRLLSTISRTLNNKTSREEIITKNNPIDVRESFLRLTRDEVKEPTAPKCIYHIALQKEEKLNEILQALSTLSAEVSIIQAADLGEHLHKLPLFASFWNSDEKGYHVLIVGLINKKLANELIRNVDTIVGGLDKHPGTLVTIQDVLISSGSLN